MKKILCGRNLENYITSLPKIFVRVKRSSDLWPEATRLKFLCPTAEQCALGKKILQCFPLFFVKNVINWWKIKIVIIHIFHEIIYLGICKHDFAHPNQQKIANKLNILGTLLVLVYEYQFIKVPLINQKFRRKNQKNISLNTKNYFFGLGFPTPVPSIKETLRI